ncbi:hypothetical protein QUO16_004426 [Vibrio parahaemolyticus]|uniref:hypothetical protein n=1 Tax=Vibrio parahaemolyticus TaxID=670 RepID=UPI000A3C95E1|nr:hypothetical protein [Vibrio parahaemolyticus]ELA9373104.1 hypothetical protein [Vibrio parahaemolyticus]OUJ48296.1 hypothetical protein BTM22_24155 [Vibrio parahaemolyticus]TOE59038.1 hypothetical protein CGJ40_13025 [Vibrio parahaemolyticus]
MTSIVSWFNPESNGEVWVVGDSKITDGRENPSMLLDAGAKVFSIPLICKAPGSTGFFDELVLESKVGLAFAGSSLIGLNVHAALSTVFSNLNRLEQIPSMEELAEYTRMIAKSYIDTLAVMRQEGALCEFLFVGFCHVTNRYKICEIRPDFTSGMFELELIIHDSVTARPEEYFVLGDKKEEIRSAIDDYRADKEPDDFWWQRAPKVVLQEIIQEERYETIGGHLQLGICVNKHFLPFSSVVGTHDAYLSYLGFDVTGDASRIGGSMVGITGMW